MIERRALWITVALLALAAPPLAAEEVAVDGHPFRGREIFADKGCLRCHSIWRHGGHAGPDITQVVAGKSWHQLIGDFWNHTPRMIDAVEEGGYAWPTFERAEMADLLSYLYYLRLFDEPGDAKRGADTYARLRCPACHTLAGEGGSGGGALDSFSAYPSPMPLAQAMWNSGPEMRRAQLEHGVRIPEFSRDEMADLQAFVRAEGVRTGRDVVLQSLPDPEAGARVFAAKRCVVCHGDAGEGSDLAVAARSREASEISGMLWNHSYAMAAEMRAQGIPFPRFEDQEFSDLIAYLYFLGFRGADGSAAGGREVFVGKGCAVCHQDAGEALDLIAATDVRDRVGLALAMWNHAPQMHSEMDEQSVSWPQFESGEMADLAAYLFEIASAGGERD